MSTAVNAETNLATSMTVWFYPASQYPAWQNNITGSPPHAPDLSNTAALLHLHHHQRHIIPLRLAIRKSAHLIQDAFDDLLRCSAPTRAQQIF